MSKSKIDCFEVESPEQAVEVFCAYVVTFASRLYADTTTTTGEPTRATKTELIESLKAIEADNRHSISLGRCVIRTGLYKDTVIEVVSALSGLGAALSGAILAIRRTDDPKAINETYDMAVGQGQEYRRRLTDLSTGLCERMYAGLSTGGGGSDVWESPAMILCSVAVDMADGVVDIDPKGMKRLCEKEGLRYISKGRRGKVHVQDWLAFLERKQDIGKIDLLNPKMQNVIELVQAEMEAKEKRERELKKYT